jgi:spore maturation protein CgeB
MTASAGGTNRRLLIVGNPEQIHVGAHLARAARKAGLAAHICDTRAAFAVPRLVLLFHWRLRGHHPPQLRAFGRHVVETCASFRPQWLLATGLAPLSASVLREVRQQRVDCINYLTDDPWNSAHRSDWFLDALPSYDRVFTPRRSNLQDLEDADCQQVAYLPFAYDPDLHFPEALATEEEKRQFGCDVLFFGGADRDRLPYITALLGAGLHVHLYGGYWERFSETKAHARGHADPSTLRKAVAGAKVTLCLVRQANRDGHVMRTFEAPAMGACMLVQATTEHYEILGEEQETALYFHTVFEMIEKARWLVAHSEVRARLAAAVYARVIGRPNTYQDRLGRMVAETKPIDRTVVPLAGEQ